jgi:hypothetical protein
MSQPARDRPGSAAAIQHRHTGAQMWQQERRIPLSPPSAHILYDERTIPRRISLSSLHASFLDILDALRPLRDAKRKAIALTLWA